MNEHCIANSFVVTKTTTRYAGTCPWKRRWFSAVEFCLRSHNNCNIHTVLCFFFPVNHFNSCILCFTSYDVISHYGIFLCCVSPWRLTKKGVTCRRITTCLHMIESNYPAVVGICAVIFWNVAPCGLVNSCWYCSGVYCVFKQYKKTLDSEDRGKTLLREVGIYLSTGRNILEGLYVQLKAIWRYGIRRVCWVGQGVQGGGPRSSWGTIPIFPGENE